VHFELCLVLCVVAGGMLAGPAVGMEARSVQILEELRSRHAIVPSTSEAAVKLTSTSVPSTPISTLIPPKLSIDVIVLVNGDRLSGKLQSMFDGSLTFSAYGNDTVKLPFKDVRALSTCDRYRSFAKDGSIFEGPILSGNEKGLVISTSVGAIEVPYGEIVSIDNLPHIAKLEKEAAAAKRFNLGKVWSGSLSFGYANTSGNSSSNVVNTDVEATRKTKQDKIFLDAHYNRAQATGTRSADAIRGGMRLDVNFSDKLFYFVFGRVEVDKIQLLDLRTTVGSGIGHTFYDHKRGHLDLGVGMTYVRDTYEAQPTKSDLTALVSFNWDRKLDTTSTFKTRLLYYPDFSDFSDFRIESDTKFDYFLTRSLSLTLGVTNRFDSTPLLGKKQNDMTVTSSVSKRF